MNDGAGNHDKVEPVRQRLLEKLLTVGEWDLISLGPLADPCSVHGAPEGRMCLFTGSHALVGRWLRVNFPALARVCTGVPRKPECWEGFHRHPKLSSLRSSGAESEG